MTAPQVLPGIQYREVTGLNAAELAAAGGLAGSGGTKGPYIIPFNAHAGVTRLLNIPAELTAWEWSKTQHYRVNLTGFTRIAVHANVPPTRAANRGCKIVARWSLNEDTDPNNWQTLSTVGDCEVLIDDTGLTILRDGPLVPLRADTNKLIYLAWFTKGGDGLAFADVGNVYLIVDSGVVARDPGSSGGDDSCGSGLSGLHFKGEDFCRWTIDQYVKFMTDLDSRTGDGSGPTEFDFVNWPHGRDLVAPFHFNQHSPWADLEGYEPTKTNFVMSPFNGGHKAVRTTLPPGFSCVGVCPGHSMGDNNFYEMVGGVPTIILKPRVWARLRCAFSPNFRLGNGLVDGPLFGGPFISGQGRNTTQIMVDENPLGTWTWKVVVRAPARTAFPTTPADGDFPLDPALLHALLFTGNPVDIVLHAQQLTDTSFLIQWWIGPSNGVLTKIFDQEFTQAAGSPAHPWLMEEGMFWDVSAKINPDAVDSWWETIEWEMVDGEESADPFGLIGGTVGGGQPDSGGGGEGEGGGDEDTPPDGGSGSGGEPGDPPPPPNPGGGGGVGVGTHEPSGMEVLVDEPFDEHTPPNWIVQNAGGTMVHLDNEVNESISPPGALAGLWGIGNTTDNAGLATRNFPARRHIYSLASYLVKSPSCWGGDGFEKVDLHYQTGGCLSRAHFELSGPVNSNNYSGSMGMKGFYGLYDGSDEPNLPINGTNVTVSHDVWFTREIELIASSSNGAPDGVYRLWVNGILVWDYTNLRMSSCPWEAYFFFPQFGDQQSRIAPQYVVVGHVYISGKN